MLVIDDINILREYIQKIRYKGKRIALVPTMGNLHDGHMKLIYQAKLNNNVVIVSIFINPMQFDNYNDLLNYPRTFKYDYEKLNKHQVDLLFAPKTESIYPKGTKKITFINVPSLSNIIEGANRPGHFFGVATIISKLFNLIQPNVAYFGEKDYQQLILIRKMVYDMNYDIDIISVPTVRDKDGLALSSRNINLTPEQRRIAPNLNKILNEIANSLNEGKFCMKDILSSANRKLNEKGFQNGNIQIRDAYKLSKINNSSKSIVILISAFLGNIRLIDNKIVNIEN